MRHKDWRQTWRGQRWYQLVWIRLRGSKGPDGYCYRGEFADREAVNQAEQFLLIWLAGLLFLLIFS